MMGIVSRYVRSVSRIILDAFLCLPDNAGESPAIGESMTNIQGVLPGQTGVSQTGVLQAQDGENQSIAWQVEYYKTLNERNEKASLLYQSQLYHAWKALREHQKGMQRQARRMKRVRLEGSKEQRVVIDRLVEANAAMVVMLDWLDRNGGLGSDVHERIRATLDIAAANQKETK